MSALLWRNAEKMASGDTTDRPLKENTEYLQILLFKGISTMWNRQSAEKDSLLVARVGG